MENRDRDKLSKNTGSTPTGDVNRSTSSDIEHQKSGSSVDFGQKVGRSENIESDRGSSGSRQSGSIGDSGMKSDKGRTSGSSDIGDIDRSDMGDRSKRGGSSNESL